MKNIFLAICLSVTLPLNAQTILSYNVNVNGSVRDSYTSIQNILYKATRPVHYMHSNPVYTERIFFNESSEAVEYSYKSLNTDITFRKKQNHILVAGTANGSPYSSNIDINGCKWYGNLESTLLFFASNDFAPICFFLADPENPDNSSPLQLQLLETPFTIPANLAVSDEILFVSMTPTGWMSPFWRADIIIDAHGNLLYYKADKGPGTAVTEKTATAITYE